MRKKIYFSQLIRGALILEVLIAIIFCIQQYIFDYNYFADATTYLTIISFCCLFYILSYRSNISSESLIRQSIIFMLLLMPLQRIIFLIPFPESFLGNPKLNNVANISIDDFNLTTQYFFVNIVVVILGVIIGGWIYQSIRNKNIRSHKLDVDIFRLRYYIFFSVIVIIGINLFFSTEYDWRMGSKWEMGWVSRFLPVGFIIPIFILALFSFDKLLSIKEKYILILLVVSTQLSTLLEGSRSAIFNIFILFILAKQYIDADFSIIKKHIVLIVLFGAILSPIVWITGTAIRQEEEILSAFFNVNFGELVSTISFRLGGAFDNYIIVITDKLNKESISEYMNITNILTAAINGFVPGDIGYASFEGLGNLWLKLAWGEDIGSRVHGEAWYMFGQFYLLFGGVISILVVLIYSVIFSFFICLLRDNKSFIGHIIGFYLLLTFFVELVKGKNIDSMIIELLYMLAYTYFIYLFVVVFGQGLLYSKIRGR